MASENNEIGDLCKFSKLSVRELKDFLRERGAHVSGNRPELIIRARGIEKLGTRTLSDVKLDDEEDRIKREGELFVTPFGEKLPKPSQLKGCWDENLSKVPLFRQEDLYNYLVLNRNRTFDKENMNAKKQLKAKVFYEDRHVHSVRYHEISAKCSHCYIRAKVIPSLPTDNKKKDYEPWVCLSKMTGMVHGAGCDCPAGDGESCNHVAALLYALVDISGKKTDGTNVPTSEKCLWNQPRKRKLSPKPSKMMVFKKLKIGSSKTNRTPFAEKEMKKKSNLHAVRPIDLGSFCQKLRDCSSNSALLLCDAKTTEDESNNCEDMEPIPQLHSVNMCYSDKTALDSDKCREQFASYMNGLKCNEEECKKIETLTKGQQACGKWKESRVGRITSSVFGTICKLKASTKPDNIIKCIMNYSTVETKATKWGNSHEIAARRIYQKNVQKLHPGLKVYSSGLVVSSKYPHLGTSPDGVVVCCEKCRDRNGLVEVKCPFKHRLSTLEEACKDTTFCCEMFNGHVKLKRRHSYYFQVQGQLALTGRSWCDFFVWTLKANSVERIWFDQAFWDEMVKKLNSFYLTAVIPELFSERIKRGKTLYTSDSVE